MQSYPVSVEAIEGIPATQPGHVQNGVALFAVVLVHVAVIAAFVMSPSEPKVLPTTEPAIMGVLVSSEAETVRELPKPVPPQPKQAPPAPAPLPPVKNAPPSEKAITAPPQEPAPVVPAPPVPAPPSPAPVAAAAPAPAAPVAVTPPRSDASHLNNPAPVYPAMSRRLLEQGKVVLDVYILPTGLVGEVRLKTSSGFKRLDEAALQAVKKWKYVPARRGDEAIPYWYVQPLSFSLNN